MQVGPTLKCGARRRMAADAREMRFGVRTKWPIQPLAEFPSDWIGGAHRQDSFGGRQSEHFASFRGSHTCTHTHTHLRTRVRLMERNTPLLLRRRQYQLSHRCHAQRHARAHLFGRELGGSGEQMQALSGRGG